jgi:hypothetical protein
VSLICILFFFFSFDLMISGVGLAWRSRVRCPDPTISVTAIVGYEKSVPVIGGSDLLTHLSTAIHFLLVQLRTVGQDTLRLDLLLKSLQITVEVNS